MIFFSLDTLSVNYIFFSLQFLLSYKNTFNFFVRKFFALTIRLQERFGFLISIIFNAKLGKKFFSMNKMLLYCFYRGQDYTGSYRRANLEASGVTCCRVIPPHSYKYYAVDSLLLASLTSDRRAKGRYLRRCSGTNLQHDDDLIRSVTEASHSYIHGLQLDADKTPFRS